MGVSGPDPMALSVDVFDPTANALAIVRWYSNGGGGVLDPARAAVDDGADRGEAVVADGPSPGECSGPWPDAATSPAWLDEVFPSSVAPPEDRIF